MRVLLSAYACEPGRGSEPYVGWTWAQAIARFADVHVITRTENRTRIEPVLAERPNPNLTFHYWDPPGWRASWENGGRGLRLHAYLWQMLLPREAERLHRRYRFDVAHHLTFAGLAYPPGVAALDIPLIWGPVGGLRVPAALRSGLHASARARERIHDLALAASRVNPLTRRAFRRAEVLVALPDTWLPDDLNGRTLTAGNIYIDADRVPGPDRAEHPGGRMSRPLHLVTACRMVFWKGLDLGLEAVAELGRRGRRVRWSIIGDGPERSRSEHLVRRVGATDRVRFRGWLERSEVLSTLSKADILLHPSFREGWGGVVLEGMAAGLPVVCLNWGGPGHIVDAETGFPVPIQGGREEVVQRIADSLDRLADPELRCRMGRAAQERVSNRFSLAVLDRRVSDLYARLRS